MKVKQTFPVFKLRPLKFRRTSCASGWTSEKDSDSLSLNSTDSRKDFIKLKRKFYRRRRKGSKMYKVQICNPRVHLMRHQIAKMIAVISVIIFANAFLFLKASQRENINLIFLSTSICLIDTIIGCILIGILWEKYYPLLAKLCYSVSAVSLSLYLCIVCFFVKYLYLATDDET